MTLDILKPTDQELVSMLPYWIRQTRAAVNNIDIEAGSVVTTTTNLSLPSGTTAMVVGTDLSAVSIEIVLLSALGASVIEQIRGGTEGDIKIFIMQDNDISFKDGAKESGKIYLNQLPVYTDFNAQRDDILALVNIGGNGSSTYGYWKEVFRTLSVK